MIMVLYHERLDLCSYLEQLGFSFQLFCSTITSLILVEKQDKETEPDTNADTEMETEPKNTHTHTHTSLL